MAAGQHYDYTGDRLAALLADLLAKLEEVRLLLVKAPWNK